MHLARMITGVALLAAGVAGCQRSVNVPQGQLNDTPMIIDEAMQIRDWERMSAYYENPRFIAGPTGFWFETPYYPPELWYAATDSFLFLAQTAMLPVTLTVNPLFVPQVYAGETLPPTYHGMPPLPPMQTPPPAPTSPDMAEPVEPPMSPEEPAEPETPAMPEEAPAPEPPPEEPLPATQPSSALNPE